jgi:hypothetical protein
MNDESMPPSLLPKDSDWESIVVALERAGIMMGMEPMTGEVMPVMVMHAIARLGAQRHEWEWAYNTLNRRLRQAEIRQRLNERDRANLREQLRSERELGASHLRRIEELFTALQKCRHDLHKLKTKKR